MSSALRWSRLRCLTLALAIEGAFALTPARSGAQQPLAGPTGVQRVELIAGRSFPIGGGGTISKVTVATPTIADVVVISETEVVVNGIAAGETDIILWGANNTRRHYRVVVRSSPERRQVLLMVKFAEVRRDALRQIGTSLLFRPTPGSTRVGTGSLSTPRATNEQGQVIGDLAFAEGGNPLSNGAVSLGASRFLTVLSTFNSSQLLGLIEAEEQIGNARSLAEPNLMAANREEASFLAGGEIPIPVVAAASGGGAPAVSILYREFGIRLNFTAEVLSDSLIKLKVRPEVSTLDYGNAITLSGFRIPALRTRRVESTVDVLADRSLIISGLFNEEREKVKTGLPFISSIPILGDLLSSQRWLKNESELIVIVTPVMMDPNNPRGADLVRLAPTPGLPAREAIEKRLPPSTVPPATRRPPL
jgi:pilus assembly protein CpaC